MQKTIKLETVKDPNQKVVPPRIAGLPDGWSQIGMAFGTSTIRIAFPGTVNPIEGSMTGQTIDANLGSAVTDAGDKSVPTRSLRVYRVRKEDGRIKNCGFSSAGERSNIEKNLSFGSVPYKFCGTTGSEAAMGNRYHLNAFAAKIGDEYLVLELMVHSVACENFEKPEEQCLAYDEKRDTAIFAEILSRLTVE